MNSKSRRYLAAILFIDLVDYTAMMQKNEEESLKKLSVFTKTLKQSVLSHDGKVLNDYGDGCLCSFTSTVDAVECARALQENFLSIDILARVGIHVGDVVEQDGNLFGDGVNIASRIESLGVGGSVLFSKQVASHLRSHPNLKRKSIGQFHFKNIDEPIEVFALANEGFPIPEKGKIKGKLKVESKKPLLQRVLPIAAVFSVLISTLIFFSINGKEQVSVANWVPNDTKSIAVLPFMNIEAKESNDYFSEGIMEEILTQLQQIGELKVKSRTSVMMYKNVSKRPNIIGQELNVAYLLEGSVRRFDNFIKVKVSLVDVEGENHLWSNEYEGEIETSSILGFQNKIAEQIGISLKAEITPTEKAKIEKLATQSEAAYDFYLKGNYYFNRQAFYDKTNTQRALEMYESAIAEDSSFVLAHLALAACHRYFYFYKFDSDVTRIQKAREHLQKAFDFEPNLPEGIVEKAWQLYHFERKYDEAIALLVEVKKEIPNNIHVYSGLGSCYKRQGDLITSENEYIQALEIDPNNRILLYNIAQATEHNRDYTKTKEYLNRVIHSEPENAIGYSLLARAYINGSWDLEKASEVLSNTTVNKGFLSTHQKYRILYGSRHYEEAIDFLDNIGSATLYDGQNDFVPTDMCYAYCYYKLGNDSAQVAHALKAVEFLKTKIASHPDDFRYTKVLGICYALAHNKELALEFAQKSKELMPPVRDVLMHSFAQHALLDVYIFNGQYDEAIDQINNMMNKPGHLTVAILKNDPTYDVVRRIPAFENTINRYNLKG